MKRRVGDGFTRRYGDVDRAKKRLQVNTMKVAARSSWCIILITDYL